MVWFPSMTIDWLALFPWATVSAFASVEAELTAARKPFSAAMRACPVRSMNLGAAMAARMPRIRITTISSISVKPRVCFVIFVSLKNLRAYRFIFMLILIIHKPFPPAAVNAIAKSLQTLPGIIGRAAAGQQPVVVAVPMVAGWVVVGAAV